MDHSANFADRSVERRQAFKQAVDELLNGVLSCLDKGDTVEACNLYQQLFSLAMGEMNATDRDNACMVQRYVEMQQYVIELQQELLVLLEGEGYEDGGEDMPDMLEGPYEITWWLN